MAINEQNENNPQHNQDNPTRAAHVSPPSLVTGFGTSIGGRGSVVKKRIKHIIDASR